MFNASDLERVLLRWGLASLCLLLAILYGVYRALQQLSKQAPGEAAIRPSQLVAGAALAGLVASSMLAALVLLGNLVNLRTVFIKASPELYALLTFRLPLWPGIAVLLAVGLLIGFLVARLYLLPGRVRQAVILGLALVPLIAVLHSALFAGSGLGLPVAIVLFALLAAASYVWSGSQTQVKSRVASLSPAGRRSLSIGAWVFAAAIVLLAPQLGSYPADVLDMVGIFALMGLGLNIVVGYAGLLDLGYVAFFAVGAYTMALLTAPLLYVALAYDGSDEPLEDFVSGATQVFSLEVFDLFPAQCHRWKKRDIQQ